jgi:sialate O-acetylesterase
MPNETRAGLRLGALFTDHLVLQQERPCRLWGSDEPGRHVSVQLRVAETRAELATARVQAAADGRFQVELPALAAGGPYELSVEGSQHITLRDVWVGEVWLASGQSNMEWKVASSKDAELEIEAADWPSIRMFKVAPRAAQQPEQEVEGAWAICSPETAVDFSAVGYFFARELHQARGVAVGIIDATWGGTCIEAWLSLEALAPVLPDLPAQRAALAAQLHDVPRLKREYERAFVAWQREHLPGDDSNQGLARGWAQPDLDDHGWPSMPLPSYWQTRGLAFNGVVWFRTFVDIPRELRRQGAGAQPGRTRRFRRQLLRRRGSRQDAARHARVAPAAAALPAERQQREGRSALHRGAGVRSLWQRRLRRTGERAVRGARGWAGGAHSAHGCLEIPGGARDPARADGCVSVGAGAAPRAGSAECPASLFHGMIAPLVPYALRGAIWYQGESNTARAAQYAALLVALIRDWRTRFGQGQFPFYQVQLANFRGAGDWPRLREAQAQALSEPQTGMAVSLDIGESLDIHPKNKQEVGRRLSLLARAHCYGERELSAEGPRVAQVVIRGREVRVRFSQARGLRTSDGLAVRGFALAGPTGPFAARRAPRSWGRRCGSSVRPSASPAPCATPGRMIPRQPTECRGVCRRSHFGAMASLRAAIWGEPRAGIAPGTASSHTARSQRAGILQCTRNSRVGRGQPVDSPEATVRL